MSSNEEDCVNLDGVFRKHQHAHYMPKGVRMVPFMDYSSIPRNEEGFTKFNVVGFWMCGNSACDLFGELVHAEASLIWNDYEDKQHYASSYDCQSCNLSCVIQPVVVFVEYVSEQGLKRMRVRMRRDEAQVGRSPRGVAEVHVLANRGTQPSMSKSPHPGRVLGVDGQVTKSVRSDNEAVEDSSGDVDIRTEGYRTTVKS